MTIRETCFPLFFYLALVIHPADRHFERSEKSFSSPFSHDSFAKPFTGSTVPAFPAIRCFPFFAIGHSPSYRQRKRSLGSARDDDTGRTRFPHILCMMHEVFILHTIISSVARNGNTGRTFSQRTLYTIQRISIPPHCHFERSEKSFSSPFSTTPSLSRLREAPPPPFRDTVFPVFRYRTLALLPPTKKIEGFARDDVAEMAFSKHIRCTLREINPFPPFRHFERSEKSSLQSALSCSFRKRFPLFRCHTYDAIPVCKKDPSASLGMTIRE